MMLHTRDEALALLRRYNKEPFHTQRSWAMAMRRIFGLGQACSTTLTLNSGRKSIARRHRNCCGKPEQMNG